MLPIDPAALAAAAALALGGDRVLVHEAIIDAPVADVWEAFTTTEGIESWMVPHGEIDLRVGGLMRTNYHADGTLGDPGTIVNEVISFEPGRMLSIRNVQAPHDFEFAEQFRQTWMVIHFDPQTERTTKVRTVGVGYGSGPGWDELYDFFSRGNVLVLEALQRHFAPGADAPHGPVVVNPDPSGAGDMTNEYVAAIAAAAKALAADDVKETRRWLDRAPARLRGWEWRYLDARSDRSAAVWEVHADAVYAVTVSPDGTQLASASADRTVRILDLDSGTVLATLTGHEGTVYDVAYSRDGSLLASASRDRTIRLWNAETQQPVRTITDPDSHVMSVAFSPDGSSIAGSLLSYVKIWQVATGELDRVLEGHVVRPPVVALDWSDDGSRLASAGWDNWTIVWDPETGEALHKLGPGYGAEDYVQFTAVDLSPDGSLVVAAGSDGTWRLWSGSGEQLAVVDAHERDCLAVAFSPDGSVIASGGADGLVKLWDAGTGERLAVLPGHTAPVRTLAFSPDGSTLVSGAEDRTIRRWDADPAAYGQSWQAQATGPWGLDYTPDGSLLVTASAEEPGVWAMPSRRLVTRLEGHTAEPCAASCAPDNRRVATCANDGTVRVWDLRSGEQLFASAEQPGYVQDVEWSADGRFIAGCAARKAIRVWDGETYEEVWSIQEHSPRWVAFSPDASMLAAGCADGAARIWNTGSFELAREMPLETDGVPVLVVRFSPDGSQLAGAAGDATIRLWDVKSGRQERVLRGHDRNAYALEFLPDGSRLVSGAYDSSVRLWDPSSGECVLTIASPEWVWALDVSPDGETIAWCPVDGRVVLATAP